MPRDSFLGGECDSDIANVRTCCKLQRCRLQEGNWLEPKWLRKKDSPTKSPRLIRRRSACAAACLMYGSSSNVKCTVAHPIELRSRRRFFYLVRCRRCFFCSVAAGPFFVWSVAASAFFVVIALFGSLPQALSLFVSVPQVVSLFASLAQVLSLVFSLFVFVAAGAFSIWFGQLVGVRRALPFCFLLFFL